MSRTITKKYLIPIFIITLSFITSLIYVEIFSKQKYVFASQCPAQLIDVINETDFSINPINNDRYVGGVSFYDNYRSGTGCSDCSPDGVPNSRHNVQYKLPGNFFPENVLSRELVNKDWSLICDSQSRNNIVHYFNSYCGGDISRTLISDEQKAYIDLGSEAGKYLDIRLSTDNPSSRYWGNGLVWEGFDDEHNITLTNTSSNPDDMIRIDIYVNDIFLKTIFPESTVANFKIKGSELLRLIDGSYRVFSDGAGWNKGQSNLKMRIFGNNGQKTLNQKTSVFTPKDNYLPDVTPDMTVYKNTGWTSEGVGYITFHSLNEPIYFNQYYIDPSMTPITLKGYNGHQEASGGLYMTGNFIMGDGWYMDPYNTSVGFETVDIDYSPRSSIFYQGEPIYESFYQYETGGYENTISNVRLNDEPISGFGYQFDTNTGTLIIPGIPLGENNIKFDIVSEKPGNSYSDSIDKDIYIIERDGLDKVRQYAFNNNKYHHEPNVKIIYETSWGTSAEIDKGLYYYSYGSGNLTMKQIITKQIIGGGDAPGIDYVRARPVPYNGISNFVPREEDMAYRVDYHQSLDGMDYNSSIDYTMIFNDGTEFTGTINISDLFSVNRIKDITAVGTAFSVDVNPEYIKPSYGISNLQSMYFNWEESIVRNGNVSTYEIEGYNDGGSSVSTTYSNTFSFIGKNSLFGILEQPDQSETYGHPTTQSGVTVLENRSFNNNFVTSANLFGYTVFNVPFGEPHSYLGSMCPISTGDLDIPVDQPLDPPNDPGDPKIILSSTLDKDCYSPLLSSSMEVELIWNSIGGVTGYSIYLDENNDGIFSDTEKIEDLSRNKKNFKHNISDNPDYGPGKQYSYQVKSFYDDGTSKINTIVVTIPSEICLECGNSDGKTVSQKPTSDLCTTGNATEVLSGTTGWGDLTWNWFCERGEEQTDICEANCPYGSILDGDRCYNPICGSLDGSKVSSMPDGYDSNLCSESQEYYDFPVYVYPMDDDWDGVYDRWNWDCNYEGSFACSAYCPEGQTISSDGTYCEGEIVSQCGSFGNPSNNSIADNLTEFENRSDLCPSGTTPTTITANNGDDGWTWQCSPNTEQCAVQCPTGEVLDDTETRCVLESPPQCGQLSSPTPVSQIPSGTNSDFCASESIQENFSINNTGWSWDCAKSGYQTISCDVYCDNNEKVDPAGDVCIVDDGTTNSVEILQFVSNPRIINPGDSCLFDWQIDTDNSNLISCTITSDNPNDASSKKLGIRKDVRGRISGSTIDDSDYPFVNVNSTTEYTLTCNEYDPDTNIVGSFIDSEKTKCMINPAFYEF